MQFTQKKIINIVIIIAGLILLLMPAVGLFKSLYHEIEDEIREPEIIERDEIIEEIEYINSPTIVPRIDSKVKDDEEDND